MASVGSGRHYRAGSFRVNDGFGQFSPLCVSELSVTRIYPEVHVYPVQLYFIVQDLLCASAVQQDLPIIASVGELPDTISL